MARSSDLPGSAILRQPGMIESLQIMLRAFIEYFLVRWELAGLESREAFQKLIKAAVAFVIALLCLAVGFLYLSLSLVYLLAVKVAWGWGWALFASGLLMLIIMAIGLLWAKSALKGNWYPVTAGELKKDVAWLKSTPNP